MKPLKMTPPLVEMRVRHHRPTRLSDPFCDFSQDELNKLVSTPDHLFGWGEFRCLLGPFLPAGTYDETVYFLPRAFNFIVQHDENALDLITSVIWFVSEYAEQLERDRLLDVARENLINVFRHWIARFEVIHYDREACAAKGWKLSSCDHVKYSYELRIGIDDLVRFDIHQDIAEQFVHGLAHHGNVITKAAWFLEYACPREAYLRPIEHPPIRKLVSDRDLLAAAAEIVISELVDIEPSPTYWNDTFAWLGL